MVLTIYLHLNNFQSCQLRFWQWVWSQVGFSRVTHHLVSQSINSIRLFFIWWIIIFYFEFWIFKNGLFAHSILGFALINRRCTGQGPEIEMLTWKLKMLLELLPLHIEWEDNLVWKFPLSPHPHTQISIVDYDDLNKKEKKKVHDFL